MAYAFARMQKMKVLNLSGLESHNRRKIKNHTNKDIERSHLNYDEVLLAVFSQEEAYTQKNAVRRQKGYGLEF